MLERSPLWFRLRGLIFALIFVAGFAGGWIATSISGKPYHVSRLGLEIATGLMFLCWLLRTWGSAYLHADVVWNPNASAQSLIVKGPFRYTRSPLYLGNLCMALGIGLFASPVGFAIIVVGTLLFALMLAHYETDDLRKKFGPLVDAYVATVPALLPRLTPARVEGTSHAVPSLVQGIRSEIFTGALTVGMIVLCVFGERGVPVFTVLWVGGWIAQQILTWNRVPNATPPEP